MYRTPLIARNSLGPFSGFTDRRQTEQKVEEALDGQRAGSVDIRVAIGNMIDGVACESTDSEVKWQTPIHRRQR